MSIHEKLLDNKFDSATEDLEYNSGGGMMWSLFRTEDNGVTIYYQETDMWDRVEPNEVKDYSLEDIANFWNPNTREVEL